MVGDKLTLADARNVAGPVVYALCDDAGVFYIGRTRNPRKRFYKHSVQANEANIYLNKRLRESGDAVRVMLLATSEGALADAELSAIRVHAATLVNVCGNPARLASAWRGAPQADCPRCGTKITKQRQKLCDPCTAKLLAKPSKNDLRAEADAALAAFRASRAA